MGSITFTSEGKRIDRLDGQGTGYQKSEGKALGPEVNESSNASANN